MNTRTTSIRLKDELVDEIDSKCEKLGCCRNDYIKDAIEMKLSGHKTNSVEDEILNCTCCDDSVKEFNMKIIKNIHNSDNSGLDEDDYGKPLHAEINWNYDEDQ